MFSPFYRHRDILSLSRSSGLSTPFLFSNTALDINSASIRRLITAFLRSPNFRDEARFAYSHALTWALVNHQEGSNGSRML